MVDTRPHGDEAGLQGPRAPRDLRLVGCHTRRPDGRRQAMGFPWDLAAL